MGLFGGAGGIIGGAIGATKGAPGIDIDTRRIFQGGVSGGGRRVVIGKGPGGFDRFKLKRGKSAQQPIRALRRDLRQLRPGFGRLTQARVKAIERAEGRALGDLREQFGARRVLGSSFANREIASTTAEFGQQEEEARAQAIVQEIALRNQTAQALIKTQLAELGVATNIQKSILGIATEVAFAEAGLEAQAAADRGASVGQIFGGADELLGSVREERKPGGLFG